MTAKPFGIYDFIGLMQCRYGEDYLTAEDARARATNSQFLTEMESLTLEKQEEYIRYAFVQLQLRQRLERGEKECDARTLLLQQMQKIGCN